MHFKRTFHGSKLYSCSSKKWFFLYSFAVTGVQKHFEMRIFSVLHLWPWQNNTNMRDVIIYLLMQQQQKNFFFFFRRMQMNISAGQNKISSFNPIRGKGNVSIWSSLPCTALLSRRVFGALLCVESASNAPFLFMTNTLKGNYLDMARLISAEWARASGHSRSQTHSKSKWNINTTLECILLSECAN